MKTAKNHILMCAGLLIFALASCADPVRPETVEDVPEGMGLARIHLSSGESAQSVRTAVPSTTDLCFTLDFTAPSKTPVHMDITAGSPSPITVALAPGAWKLDVKGYTDSPVPASLKVTGTVSVSVTAGTSDNFYVDLTPAFSSGGTGSLKYSISFPAPKRGFLGLYPIDNTPGTSLEIDISSSVGTVTPINDLPAGSYRAVIDLYDSTANKAATRTEVVHIHAGRDTTLPRAFAPDDFAECPDTVGDDKTALKEKLEAALNSVSGTYTIVLDGDEDDLGSFVSQTLNVNANNKDITIILRGNGETVQLNSTGSLFTLKAGGTNSKLTLELHDITLKGTAGNTTSLVRVDSKGALVMKAGSLITGNTNSTAYGGGVYVGSGGSFTMSGGAVSGNTASTATASAYGGGVYVNSSGTFTMSGGAVSCNEAYSTDASAYGGGVHVDSGGSFTMSGGAVSGNKATSTPTATSAYGGGVYVGGSFTMNGGAVSGNMAAATGSGSGGGVFVLGGGSFTMSGGAVSGNTATSTSTYGSVQGGGVHVAGGGIFTMSGGEVSGNVLSGTNNYGKAVVVAGTLKLSGEARPERVFLDSNTQFITISGPLSGPVIPIMVDLKITSSVSLTGYENAPILKLDGSYSGNLAELKAFFALGNLTNTTTSPWTEESINGYTISDGGLFVAEE